MNRTVLAAAVTLGLLAGASLVPRPAEAMPTASAGLATTATTNPLALDVAYVCRRVWRCGPYGCGWRRACYYTRPYHPYRYYRRHFYYRRW